MLEEKHPIIQEKVALTPLLLMDNSMGLCPSALFRRKKEPEFLLAHMLTLRCLPEKAYVLSHRPQQG